MENTYKLVRESATTIYYDCLGKKKHRCSSTAKMNKKDNVVTEKTHSSKCYHARSKEDGDQNPTRSSSVSLKMKISDFKTENFSFSTPGICREIDFNVYEKQIMKIHDEVFLNFDEEWVKCLKHIENFFMGCFNDDELVGVVTYRKKSLMGYDFTDLVSIAVCGCHQKKGLGTKLLKLLEKDNRQIVTLADTNVVNFYIKMGFKNVIGNTKKALSDLVGFSSHSVMMSHGFPSEFFKIFVN